MRKLIVLVSSMFFASLSFAQMPDFDCDPGAWCHPDGLGLGQGFFGSMTEAADKVGKAMQDDPCAEQDYATQAVCKVIEVLADVVACGYPEGTPQATVCDDDKDDKKESQSYQKTLAKLKHDAYIIDTNFRPRIIDVKNGCEAFRSELEKVNRGDVVKKYDKNSSLKMEYKFYYSEGVGKGYASVMTMRNKTKKFSVLTYCGLDGKIYIYGLKEVKYAKAKGK